MRTACIGALALLVSASTLSSDVPEHDLPPGNLPTFWFPVGEQLEYKLYWGIIPVGSARATTAWVRHEGRWLVSLSFKAKTGNVVRKLFPVDDHVESLVDPHTFLPVQYTQRLREGKKRQKNVVSFDYAAGVATVQDLLKETAYDVEIDTNTRDLLSFIYFMRAEGYVPGQKADFRVLVEEKVYDLTLTGIENEKLKLRRFGKFDALKVEPEARFGEVFNRKGRVQVWFSNDERRLCAKMTGKVPVASVRAVLVGVKGPNSDAWPDS